MPDLVFPERTVIAPLPPCPVVHVVPREPLTAIRQLLGISIHDVVNDETCKLLVAEFYRITRWLENDSWLRRCLEEQEAEREIAALL